MADLRLAEILAALSQITDLGMGQPPETAIRTCLVATNMARHLGVDEQAVSDIYYVTLLQHIGCTAYAYETAAVVGGDDIAMRAGGATVDFENPREALSFLLLGVGKGAPAATRIRGVFSALRLGAAFGEMLHRSNCEAAVRTVERLGLGRNVQTGLDHIYERWDGKGNPHGLSHEAIALPARFAQVAGQGVLFHILGGPELAIATVRRRASGALDPAIAEAFARQGGDLLTELDAIDAVVVIGDAEPEPRHLIPDGQLDGVARAFADIVDLKSPYMHGHSSGLSRLAEAVAIELGLPEADIVSVRRAGFLHDLGHVGVPNGIWDKPGPLTTTEWEQVRLHPYHAERILSRSPVRAPLAPLVGMHHERQDGSGYHHQATGSAIPIGARILAAADAYQAMTEERPHRPAHSPGAAAEQLSVEAVAGRLDAGVVQAVLTVAGHAPAPARHSWPADLTDREVQVLRLAARGLSTKAIGGRLSISPKTADHHIQHIYTKIGVSTRAGAAIFAMEHDLIREQPA
ncbi:MAG: LuxR C-terminal-related transcriptional regulator [Chloroflexota bacterium]|nr:LuxR C-terminal-related transcriptional regulator [Chloroflexota bacterium]